MATEPRAWEAVCRFLGYRDVCALASVCRATRDWLRSDDRVWEEQFQKTWWSRGGEDWPPPGDSFRERIEQRIRHVKQIVGPEPVATLFLYRKKDETGNICGPVRHHKVRLYRSDHELTEQVRTLNHLTMPFRVTVDLPDGRRETFLSTEPKRRSRPLCRRIGVEYALHPTGPPDEEGFCNRVPYEALVSFDDVPQRRPEDTRRNVRELRDEEARRRERSADE